MEEWEKEGEKEGRKRRTYRANEDIYVLVELLDDGQDVVLQEQPLCFTHLIRRAIHMQQLHGVIRTRKRVRGSGGGSK